MGLSAQNFGADILAKTGHHRQRRDEAATPTVTPATAMTDVKDPPMVRRDPFQIPQGQKQFKEISRVG
jgi:hypothetical protein